MTGRVRGLALAVVVLGGCSNPEGPAGEDDTVTIKGSDTIVHLVSDWAEVYLERHPEADVAVSGGGSGAGIKAFINGTTDIAAASRDVNEEEEESAARNGRVPRIVPVALDGIAVIVNPRNPIDELTIEQLRKLYTGAYANWSEVGGPDAVPVVLSRESSSGTYAFFQEHVLRKQDYAAQVRLMPATAGIIQAVSQDRWAIGYVGLGYATGAGKRVKVVKVKADPGAPAVTPSEETIRTGAYAIARPLVLVTLEMPPTHVQAFVDFALSDEGQQIVRRNDYIPIR